MRPSSDVTFDIICKFLGVVNFNDETNSIYASLIAIYQFGIKVH